MQKIRWEETGTFLKQTKNKNFSLCQQIRKAMLISLFTGLSPWRTKKKKKQRKLGNKTSHQGKTSSNVTQPRSKVLELYIFPCTLVLAFILSNLCQEKYCWPRLPAQLRRYSRNLSSFLSNYKVIVPTPTQSPSEPVLQVLALVTPVWTRERPGGQSAGRARVRLQSPDQRHTVWE